MANIITEEKMSELYALATKASEGSYSPYSHFPVGAALLTSDGAIYTGANIENRSFGLTNCAERTAAFKAAADGHLSFVAIAIATPTADYPVGPCGACRQVLSEFAKADMQVWFGANSSNIVKTTLGELYPFDSLHELAENR